MTHSRNDRMYRCDRCLLLMTSGMPLDGWRCRCKTTVFPQAGDHGGIRVAEIYDAARHPHVHPDDQPLRYVGTLAEYLGC